MSGRPPYRVPSMAEVAEMRGANGYRVVSTFSGCGGSCLGFEMAGFEIIRAHEFIEAATETYRANHASVPVDTRDIRSVTAEQLLDSIGMGVGDLDVLEGSPPCASFSAAGKGSRHWGKVKRYSDKAQRTDDLFFEFARLLAGTMPRAFVAENVAGLVRGKAKGYFIEILRALRDCGYRVEARVLDAQWLGVPQRRNRLIFVGVRNDLTDRRTGLPLAPTFPSPLPYRYSLSDAIGVEFSVLARPGWSGELVDVPTTEPAPTVCAFGIGGSDDTQMGILDPWQKDRRAIDPETGERIDLYGMALYRDWQRYQRGQATRYINSALAEHDQPVPTITASGGPRGAAGVMLAKTPRKFTLAELRRICSFPDDFVLTGKYSQRWERLGRSVPPLMMFAIAERVRDDVLQAAA